jgi:transcriptional regulator with XRE-family HTH domain
MSEEVIALTEALKRVLKARGLGYADVAAAIGISVASVKRIFAERTFTLERFSEICSWLGISVYELARLGRGLPDDGDATMLTFEQEELLAADPKLFSLFYLLLNGLTPTDVVKSYDFSKPECARGMLSLDRAGLLALHPGDRVQLLVARQVKWRENGPLRTLYAEPMKREFVDASFTASGEFLRFVTGDLTPTAQRMLHAKIAKLLRDFDELSEVSTALPAGESQNVSLMIAVRPWVFSVIARYRRRFARQAPEF